MRFIVFLLQRTLARRNETPLQAATVSVLGLRHDGRHRGRETNVLIKLLPRDVFG
jgi:hypothetical protein